jgi:uncharacterized protein
MMPIRRSLSVTLVLLALFACAPAHPQRRFLPAIGWISDFANVLDSDTQRRLTILLQEVDQKTHARIAVVTVESLAGVPIENYTTSLFNEWGIGYKGDNRGVLILLATSDQEWRIEVSRGLGSLLPNERVGRIGGKMVSDLQHHDYSRAVLGATDEIATIIAADRKVTLTAVGHGPAPSGSD